MSDVAIKVADLWKQYRIGHNKSTSFRESINHWFTKSEEDYFWALKELDFEVKRGEAIGIIGKNGAGKSTLLKVLSKITYPTKGRVEINGRVSSLLEVGTGFHPELTGRQNVFLNGTILGMTKKEIASKFDEIVAFSGVEKFIDTAVKHYSSGMKVRLAFSVAAHLEPEILIIDEVLAVGDAEFQKKCLGKMEDVAGAGRTVLFVSHNLSAVEGLCSHGVLLNQGKIESVGYTSEVIEKYLSRSLTEDLKKALDVTQVIIEELREHEYLRLRIVLDTSFQSKASFLAIDINDHFGVTIAQAIPKLECFIKPNTGILELLVEIDLPSLIPGNYLISVWHGPNYNETLTWVKNVVSFEVVNTPQVGRTYPHSTRQGHFVPKSRLIK